MASHARRTPARVAATLLAVTAATLVPSSPAASSTSASGTAASISVVSYAVGPAAVDRTRPRAVLRQEGRTLTVRLESVRTRRAGETVRFTDRLGPGQALRCGTVVVRVARVARDRSLVPVGRTSRTVLRCEDRLLRVRAHSPRAGRVLVLAAQVRLGPPATTATRLTHRGTIEQRRSAGRFAAALTRPAAVSPAPTPPPSPTPSSSPSPSPTPSSSRSPAPAPERVEPAGGDALDARTTTLVAGLVIFLLGGAGVTVGLRRRG